MPKTKKLGENSKTPKVKEPKYIVQFNFNGETQEYRGDDLLKIFEDWSPRIFKTVVLLTVKSGERTIERRLSVIQAKRIAGNFTNAEIFANGLLKFLG